MSLGARAAAALLFGAGGLVLVGAARRRKGAVPAVPPRECLTWALPKSVPQDVSDRAQEILRSPAALGDELVEEWDGDLWKFVVEIHGPNDQIPHNHRGVGVRICTSEA